MTMEGEQALLQRLQELLAQTPYLGYRAAHASLQAEETFKGVGLKRIQKLLREFRESPEVATSVGARSEAPDGGAEEVVAPVESELTITRPDTSSKFGMLIDSGTGARGGHAVTEVRPGGVVEAWNNQTPEQAIRKGDVLVCINGETTFDGMMAQFREKLEAHIRIRRAAGQGAEKPALVEDHLEAAKEKAAWESRRARVTAALIPGLKQIVEKEFGGGAGERIGRVEAMYQRIGRNEVFESDDASGKRYAPGFIEDLTPVLPFHRTQDYPWCAELRCEWKAIREELRNSLDDFLWTPGAYAASNEAYGKDWKIMAVLSKDTWQDEARFKVTSNVIKNLKGIKPFEAFFARMPAHTNIMPHSDNLSYILTSHLALELEEGACSIRVGNEEKYWKEGEVLVLDTTYVHSTKNESSRPRYVLVLRFWHPGLTEEERRAIHLSHAILAGASK
mmetsp:Transcript_86911/g.245117  ORF Transcript_86911/g.245117 Transcript_86911/m.245117 type:complete len:449 (-) Transcript_86911:115-1461(-)